MIRTICDFCGQEIKKFLLVITHKYMGGFSEDMCHDCYFKIEKKKSG